MKEKYVLERYCDFHETPIAIWDISNGKPGSGARLVWDLRGSGMTNRMAKEIVRIFNGWPAGVIRPGETKK